MGDGSSKDIEDVEVGDEVTAADPETGETHARRVVETYVHEDVPTYEVRTTAGAVTSTEEHPFYVQGKGWVPVRDLQPGDSLVDPKGGDVDVVSVEATGRRETVHNFEVEELHTYHVAAGETWVRVHNTCTTPRADFIVGENGTVIPTSRARLEAGFQDANLPSAPTRSPGTEYTLSDGSKVRVMDASGQAPQRASFTNGNGQPVDAFSGKPPQPPQGLTTAARKAWVRERTHVELGP
jgi:hypothetical protein